MFLRGAVDHCIKEERSRGKIDDGWSHNAKWVNRDPTQTGSDRPPDVSLPDNAARCSVERIHIIRCGHYNDHWPVWTALDVERLGVHVAHDGSFKVQVASQVSRVARRERRIDVETVPGKVIVFLGDVDLRVCRKDGRPQKNNDKR